MRSGRVWFALLCLALWGACSPSKSVPTTRALRIVSLDGAVTETLFALGVGHRLVGRDRGSIYPEAAEQISALGHAHSIQPAAIAALAPDLVLELEPDTEREMTLLVQLNKIGLRVERLPRSMTLEGAIDRIDRIAKLVDRREQGDVLIKALRADLSALHLKRARIKGEVPGVMAAYIRGMQHMYIRETGSSMVKLVEAAGGRSAFGALARPSVLNAEAMVAAQPDVILCMRRGVASIGGVEKLLTVPGIAKTKAGRARRFIVMDDAMLNNFGPRSGKAALELHRALFERQGTVVIDRLGQGGID